MNMNPIIQLEERLRKEGLPHVLYEEFYGNALLHMVSFPDATNPIVTFILIPPSGIKMWFGPLANDFGDIMSLSRKCQGGANQAHDIIVAIFMALKM